MARPAAPRTPRVAIVVPTPDAARAMTRRCLAAVEATTGHLAAAVEVVESSGPGFRFSRSVNRGIAAHPDADAWVLLNDDCVMEAGWLDAMLAAAATRGPQVGVVGAVLRYPDGRIQHAGGYIPSRAELLLHALRKAAPLWGVRRLLAGPSRACYHHADAEGTATKGGRIDFVTGACLLVTRAAHDRLGPFDEAYAFGFEDVDYNLRALDAGFEVALAAGARGLHEERATGSRRGPLVEASEAAFDQRWPWRRVLAVTRRGGRTGIRSGSSA